MDHRLIRKAAPLLAGMAAIATIGGPAGAQSRLGLLDCSLSERTGLILGAGTAIECRLLVPGVTPKTYYGLVGKADVDIAATRTATLAWEVATANASGAAKLDGEYAAAAGKRLVGGPDSAITLAPASIVSQTGANLAGSVTGLKLKAK